MLQYEHIYECTDNYFNAVYNKGIFTSTIISMMETIVTQISSCLFKVIRLDYTQSTLWSSNNFMKHSNNNHIESNYISFIVYKFLFANYFVELSAGA